MDRFRTERVRSPFVLDTGKIAAINHRANACDHPLVTLVLLATLVPADATALATAKIRCFDARHGTLAIADPTGARMHLILGQAAAAAVQQLIGDRVRGTLFEDERGDPIALDYDTVAYADELLAEGGSGRIDFGWSFRSLREGVSLGMDDGGVPFFVNAQLAGMVRTAEGSFSQALQRSQQRAAADWWATTLAETTQAAIRAAEMHDAGPTNGDDGRRGVGTGS